MEEEEEQTKVEETFDLLDIEADDPLDAIIKIDQRIRPPRSFVIQDMEDAAIVNRYYQMMKHACSLFDVSFEVTESDADDRSEAGKLLYLVKTEIDKRKLERLHSKMQMTSAVLLNADWREKIHSYLATVRGIVQNANVAEPIRESILKKLHDLDAEVDKRRTRVQKITEVLVELCKGVSSGGEELKPAVRLFERVVGAVSRLEPSAEQAPALPGPETLGLPAPETTETE